MRLERIPSPRHARARLAASLLFGVLLELRSAAQQVQQLPAERLAGPAEHGWLLELAAEGKEGPTLVDGDGPGHDFGALDVTAFNLKQMEEGSVASWNSGYGPLDLPSQAPGQVLRLGLRPRTPSTLARGQFELLWTETFANIFAFEKDDFLLDYLTLNSTLSLAYGLSDEVQLDVAVGNLVRTDSVLDPITDAFHDLFGLGDGGRSKFPARDNVIRLESPSGTFEDHSSGSEATNLALSLQHNVTHGSRTMPAVAYTLSARWDAGGNADLEGSSRLSGGIGCSASKRIGSAFNGHLALGYNWHGVDESRGLELADEQWNGLVALEWRVAENRSWILQYLISEGAAADRDPFDDPTHELDLGWKWEFTRGTVLELGLIENIIEVDNSPDFGLHFGLRHRF